MRKEQLTRREREKLRHRHEIITAAEEVFSVNGFHKTTINKIAEKAEFSVGFIYNYFKSKEDLYKKMLLDRIDSFEKILDEEVKKEISPLAKIENIINRQVDFFDQNKNFFKIYADALKGLTWEIKSNLGEDIYLKYQNNFNIYVKLFKQAAAKREIVDLDPLLLAISLTGIIKSYMEYSVHVKQKVSFKENLEIIKRIFFGQIKRNGV